MSNVDVATRTQEMRFICADVIDKGLAEMRKTRGQVLRQDISIIPAAKNNICNCSDKIKMSCSSETLAKCQCTFVLLLIANMEGSNINVTRIL